jgi:hypothetical protein
MRICCLIFVLSGCNSGDSQAEEVAMTIAAVIASGDQCTWNGSDSTLLRGSMDLLSLVSPGGAIGHSRRYPIGVKWSVNRNSEEGPGFDDSFITLKDVEVRLIYDEAVVAPPTETTRQNLPATYVVPTMGTQDADNPPIAVFDLIPTWVARRLALDAQIWVDTSSGRSANTPGKDYLLTTEFRLRGLNAGGKPVVSNWFRWVVHLCRGCRLKFTATPPARPSSKPVFPGNYTSDDLTQPEPVPSRPGVVLWCSAGVSQGMWILDLVQPSQPLAPREYQ